MDGEPAATNDPAECMRCVGALRMPGFEPDSEDFRRTVDETIAAVPAGAPAVMVRREFVRRAAHRRGAEIDRAMAAISAADRARVREILKHHAMPGSSAPAAQAFDPGCWDCSAVLAELGRDGSYAALGLAAYFLDRQRAGAEEALASLGRARA